METILHNAWSLFVAIGWFFLNRITAKVDALEKEKADVSAVKANSGLIHEGDKRIDNIQHTSVPRSEYKYDIASLHNRLNEMEKSKEDKIQAIRLIENRKETGGKTK
tara:strand:- start:1182 stop:1502 length:321 start_codon:yes stop_codon:yes gene_type:complete